MRVEAILTPADIALLPGRDLRGATCIVFDVLRATSTILTAFANGARRVYPVTTVDGARRLRASLPQALLGGEREGVRIEGFDLGNSPLEYTAKVVGGRDIIATTTNGTVALHACAGASEVLAGAWLNVEALASWLLARPASSAPLLLVCAGSGERFALEDGLAAGALIARLFSGEGAPHHALEDDAAYTLLALHEQRGSDPLAVLRASANGQRLAQIGLGADVDYCAATSLPWIGTLRAKALKGQRVEAPR